MNKRRAKKALKKAIRKKKHMKKVHSKGIASKLILLFVIILLCLVFFEFVFRWLVSQHRFDYTFESLQEKEGYQDSPFSGVYYTLEPNMNFSGNFRYTSNSLGFRTKEYDNKTKSIVILGDSVTFGFLVNDSQIFSKILEDKLTNYSVYNLGVPGYSALQYASVLKNYGAQFHPDVVLVGIYSNDLLLMTYCVHTGSKKPVVNLIKTNDFFGKIRFFIHSNSLLYQIIHYELSRYQCESEKDTAQLYKDPYFFEESMKSIQDYCQNQNVSLYLILLPTPHYNETLKFADIYPGFYDFLKENNFSVINVATHYPLVMGQEYKNGKVPLDIDDDHLNPYGHRLIAEAIYQELNLS